MTRSRNKIRNRAGFTLIHQIIFIAIMPVVLVAATSWVHESLKMSSRFKHRRESHVAMNHLANQIQDDVRGCKSLKFDLDSNQMVLTGHEDQQIVFKIEGSDVQKTLTVNGELVARERYRLSDEYFAEWDQGVAENDSGRATLNVFRYPTEYRDLAPKSLELPDPKLELSITAKANRWGRSIVFGGENERTIRKGAAK